MALAMDAGDGDGDGVGDGNNIVEIQTSIHYVKCNNTNSASESISNSKMRSETVETSVFEQAQSNGPAEFLIFNRKQTTFQTTSFRCVLESN